MSPKNTFLFDNYCYDQDFVILAVQESGNQDHDKILISNMDFISDDNRAANRGVLLYARNPHSVTKLKEISQLSTNIDTAWGTTLWGDRISDQYGKKN